MIPIIDTGMIKYLSDTVGYKGLELISWQPQPRQRDRGVGKPIKLGQGQSDNEGGQGLD